MALHTFAPAQPLSLTLSETAQGQLGVDLGDELQIVAITHDDGFQLRYLALHDSFHQPRWIEAHQVMSVKPADQKLPRSKQLRSF
jgi:hypothetical protein